MKKRMKEKTMPLYEFECKNCDKTYEDLCKYDETGEYKDVECPHCESKDKDKLASGCAFAFGDPVGTDRWNNGSTGHDYRFKHGAPRVKAERRIAEAMSHMGATPYGTPNQVEKDIELDTGVHDPETRPGLE